jgi:hypothetical protein
MEIIDLYKFITENKIEYHWHSEDVIMFVDCQNVKEFNDLLPATIFDDYGIECHMKDGYFCFEMAQICSYCDIDLIDIFPEA